MNEDRIRAMELAGAEADKALAKRIAELEKQLAASKEEVDKWKTHYYEAEEWACSCNLTNDLLTHHVCQFHKESQIDDKEIIGLAATNDRLRVDLTKAKETIKALQDKITDLEVALDELVETREGD